MAETFKIEGLREIEKALLQLRKDFDMSRATVKNIAIRTLKKAGTPIKEAAEVRAPTLFFDLEESIDVSTKLSERQKRLHRKESEVEVFVGAGPLPQAHLQEFGTVRHGAQSFMRPAWDGRRMAALSLIKGTLESEVEKSARRAARKAAKKAGQ